MPKRAHSPLRFLALFLGMSVALPDPAFALRSEQAANNTGLEEKITQALSRPAAAHSDLAAGAEEVLFETSIGGKALEPLLRAEWTQRHRSNGDASSFEVTPELIADVLWPAADKALMQMFPNAVKGFGNRSSVSRPSGPNLAGSADILRGEILNHVFHNASDAVIGRWGIDFESMEIQIKLFVRRGELWIQVLDNGKGIPSRVLDQLGKETATTKSEGAPGIVGEKGEGLLIASRSAKSHGWKLNISNRIGALGASVSLRIPLKAEESTESLVERFLGGSLSRTSNEILQIRRELMRRFMGASTPPAEQSRILLGLLEELNRRREGFGTLKKKSQSPQTALQYESVRVFLRWMGEEPKARDRVQQVLADLQEDPDAIGKIPAIRETLAWLIEMVNRTVNRAPIAVDKLEILQAALRPVSPAAGAEEITTLDQLLERFPRLDQDQSHYLEVFSMDNYVRGVTLSEAARFLERLEALELAVQERIPGLTAPLFTHIQLDASETLPYVANVDSDPTSKQHVLKLNLIQGRSITDFILLHEMGEAILAKHWLPWQNSITGHHQESLLIQRGLPQHPWIQMPSLPEEHTLQRGVLELWAPVGAFRMGDVVADTIALLLGADRPEIREGLLRHYDRILEDIQEQVQSGWKMPAHIPLQERSKVLPRIRVGNLANLARMQGTLQALGETDRADRSQKLAERVFAVIQADSGEAFWGDVYRTVVSDYQVIAQELRLRQFSTGAEEASYEVLSEGQVEGLLQVRLDGYLSAVRPELTFGENAEDLEASQNAARQVLLRFARAEKSQGIAVQPKPGDIVAAVIAKDRQGQVIGYAFVTLLKMLDGNPPILEINEIAVAPAYQSPGYGKGELRVGSSLMRELLKRALYFPNLSAIYMIDASPQGQTALMAQRLGFKWKEDLGEEVGEIRSFYALDAREPSVKEGLLKSLNTAGAEERIGPALDKMEKLWADDAQVLREIQAVRDHLKEMAPRGFWPVLESWPPVAQSLGWIEAPSERGNPLAAVAEIRLLGRNLQAATERLWTAPKIHGTGIRVVWNQQSDNRQKDLQILGEAMRRLKVRFPQEYRAVSQWTQILSLEVLKKSDGNTDPRFPGFTSLNWPFQQGRERESRLDLLMMTLVQLAAQHQFNAQWNAGTPETFREAFMEVYSFQAKLKIMIGIARSRRSRPIWQFQLAQAIHTRLDATEGALEDLRQLSQEEDPGAWARRLLEEQSLTQTKLQQEKAAERLSRAARIWEGIAVTPSYEGIRRGILPVFYADRTMGALPLAAAAGPVLVLATSAAQRQAVETLMARLSIPSDRYTIWMITSKKEVPDALARARQEMSERFAIYPVDPVRPDWLKELLALLEEQGQIPVGDLTPAMEAVQDYFQFV